MWAEADPKGDAAWRRLTGALAVLAVLAVELALAEPGEPSWRAVPPAVVGAALLVALAAAPLPSPWTPVILVGLFLAPPAIALARDLLGRPVPPLELTLLRSLRHVTVGLGALAWRGALSCRLAGLASLFLVVGASALAESPAILGVIAGYAATGGLWLARGYWAGLGPAVEAEVGSRPRRLAGPAVLIVVAGTIGLGALAAAGTGRVATALAGLLPSSGGDQQESPDARAGVQDGENEVAGHSDPKSVGYADSEIYLETDRPSLYDAFNDRYGEPLRPRPHQKMIAVQNNRVTEQEAPPPEDLRAGRTFATGRRPRPAAAGRPRDRAASALLYVQGPTPLHLPLEAYDRYDGQEWHPAPRAVGPAPVLREAIGGAWMRAAHVAGVAFAGRVSHRIKVARLETHTLPLPPNPARFRVGSVDQAQMFVAGAEGQVALDGRPIPAGTVVDVESWTIDPRSLRSLAFPIAAPDASNAAPLARRLALAWTEGVPRGARQVEAVVARLRGEFTHDPTARAPSGGEPVAHFLATSRRGPDYLFATAAVLMLRELGYPARLVSGLYAAPSSFDPARRHTPVTAGDVHVWAEVRGPDGAWITLEPTPGYEVLGPARTFWGRVAALLRDGWDWCRRHPASLAAAAVALAIGFRMRPLVADLLATIAWRLALAGTPERATRATLRLIERRARRAGYGRPPWQTPRAWLDRLGLLPELPGLAPLLDWTLYAPGELRRAGPPGPEITAICRRAGAVVRARRLRRPSALDPQEGDES